MTKITTTASTMCMVEQVTVFEFGMDAKVFVRVCMRNRKLALPLAGDCRMNKIVPVASTAGVSHGFLRS